MALVLVCILPMLVLSAALAVVDYRLERDRIYRNAVLRSQTLAAEVDRELAGIESALRLLATASELASGDLASFHRRAVDALKAQVGGHYVMTDRQGRQIINTLLPFGAPLPAPAGPVLMAPVFETGQPFLSPLFTGGVNQNAVVALGVPVFRGTEVVYSLSMGLPPERFGAALRRNVVPAGWIAALLDGSGTIVARSRDAQRFVGQKATASLLERVLAQRQGTLESIAKEGVPVFTAFSRSSVSNWSVAVGAPKAALTADANRSTAWVVAGALIALGLGLGLASRLARRITASVQGLVGPALALGSGRPVQLPPTGLQETEAVGAAISQAALMLAQAQHIAHHDGLTGLCNRLLFDEVAIRQVAAAQRNKLSLAVLAIDLDEFKTVNDMQGHAAGDAVLKLAAERITGSIRASDIAARFGGDEFAVLLADTDLAGARVIADKLVLALAMPYPNVLAAVSASIGIAVLSASNATVAELLERADRALYEAKKAGKRRAVSEG